MITKKQRLAILEEIDLMMRHGKTARWPDAVAAADFVYKAWDKLNFPTDSIAEEFQSTGMRWLNKIVDGELSGFSAVETVHSAVGLFNQCATDAYNYVQFTPFQQYWNEHKLKDRYVETFGEKGFERFREGNFAKWLDEELPRSLDGKPHFRVLNEFSVQVLFRDFFDPQKHETEEEAIARGIARLVYGDRENRWELPAVEGILTPGYWKPLIASQFTTLSDGSHLEAVSTSMRMG